MLHCKKVEEEWVEEKAAPFDELMLSWNGNRPSNGKYLFYVSAKVDEWSPWLLYASWGSDEQMSCASIAEKGFARVYQDAFSITGGKKGVGFKIKIVPEGNSDINNLWGLHVYTNGDQIKEQKEAISCTEFIHLPVGGISQVPLNHTRHMDLCSPASTTAVVRYLSRNAQIDPVHFAENVWDKGFDIFGNWVFNAAQAAVELGPNWNCWVERLSSFNDIYGRLHQGTPVIVSIRGPLPKSALPYAKGHLIAVVGYDPEKKEVICMDPAFPKNAQTLIGYNASDFIQAWNRRGKIAYVFE